VHSAGVHTCHNPSRYEISILDNYEIIILERHCRLLGVKAI